MHEGRGQRIIVLDNDRTVLELLQIRLEVAGYHAYIMRNSAQALDQIRQIRPAAMVIDTQLGDADGFDIVGAIRARYPDLHFPILMTGRNLTADDVRRALVRGAQNCIAKPFSGAEAVERIGRLLDAAHRPPAHPIEQSRPKAVAYL